MADQRTEKSPYQSRFGGGWIAPAQYLAESMCDRKARSQGKVLPLKFWEQDTWKREFLLQVRHVSGLLRLYSPDAIMRALRKPSAKRVYSFAAKWLDPLFQAEQKIIDTQKAVAEKEAITVVEAEPETPIEQTGPRPEFKRKSTTLDKLRALDG